MRRTLHSRISQLEKEENETGTIGNDKFIEQTLYFLNYLVIVIHQFLGTQGELIRNVRERMTVQGKDTGVGSGPLHGLCRGLQAIAD